MFQIGEFSKLGQVSPRMLRHYDQLGLLKPGQVDAWTGYRHYTLDQLAQLHRIIALKEMGLSLEQVGELLARGEELNPERLRAMLKEAKGQLQRDIVESQERLQRVEVRLQQLESQDELAYEIVVKPVPSLSIASIREVVPSLQNFGAYCSNVYADLYGSLRTHGITPLQPEITIYHQEEYSESEIDAEFGVAVQSKYMKAAPADEHVRFRELPEYASAAALIYEGAFVNLLDGVLTLLKWVAMHGYSFAGPMRELHLSGPAHKADDEGVVPVTELQIPIHKNTAS